MAVLQLKINCLGLKEQFFSLRTLFRSLFLDLWSAFLNKYLAKVVIHAKLNLKKLFHDRSQSLGGSPFGIHATASRCQIYNMTKSKQQMNPLKINF